MYKTVYKFTYVSFHTQLPDGILKQDIRKPHICSLKNNVLDYAYDTPWCDKTRFNVDLALEARVGVGAQGQ